MREIDRRYIENYMGFKACKYKKKLLCSEKELYKKKVEIKETLVIFHCLFECLRRSVKSFSKIL